MTIFIDKRSNLIRDHLEVHITFLCSLSKQSVCRNGNRHLFAFQGDSCLFIVNALSLKGERERERERGACLERVYECTCVPFFSLDVQTRHKPKKVNFKNIVHKWTFGTCKKIVNSWIL